MQSFFQAVSSPLDALINFHPVVIAPQTTIFEVMELICDRGQKNDYALVVEAGQVIGTVTAQDILQQVVRGLDLRQTPVGTIMEAVQVCCNYEDCHLTHVVNLWKKFQPFVLPVVNVNDGCVVGAIATHNLCQIIPDIQANCESLLKFMDAGNDVLIVCDRQGKIIDANSHFCRVLGYDWEQIYYRQFTDLVVSPVEESLWECVLGGVPVLLEQTFLGADGQQVKLEVRYCSLEVDGKSLVLLRGTDISQHQQAIAALYEVESCFRALSETAPVGIWIMDHQGKVTFVSKYLSDFTGEPTEKLRSDSCGDWVHPDDCEQNKISFQIAFSQHQPITLKYRLRRHDGEYRWHLDQASPRFNLDGEFIGYVGAAVDFHHQIEIQTEIEQALIISEATQLGALANIPQMVWMYNANREIIYVNQRVLDYFQTTLAEVKSKQSKGWHKWLHPEDLKVVLAELALKSPLGESVEMELRWLHVPSGEYRWHLGRYAAIRDSNGNIVKYLATDTDIHEFRQTQIQLKQSEARYRQLIELTSDMLWEVDREGIITYVSPNVEKLLGYSPQELIGQSLFGFMSTIEKKRFQSQWLSALANDYAPLKDLEIEKYHKNGDSIYLEVSGLAIFDEDGNWCGYRGVKKNITARKKAEAALYYKNSQLQAILDYSPALIYLVDLDNRYILGNQKIARLFNLSPQDLVGKHISEFLPPETAAECITSNTQAVQLGAPIKVEEFVKNPDNTQHTYISVKFPLRDTSGKIYAVCGISTDITERKHLEENLIRFQKAIETTVDGVAIANAQGQVIYINPAFVSRMGYTLEELNQGNNSILIYGQRKCARRVYHHIVQGQPWNGEVVMEDAAGQLFDAKMRADAICDRHEQVIGYVAIYTETTEMRHMEEMIRLRDRALSVGTHGVSISNMRLPDAPLSYVNDSFERLTGFQSHEVIGRNCRFLQRFDHHQPGLEGLKSAIRRRATYTAAIRNYTKNGTMFVNELTIAPVFDQKGHLTHYVGVQRDVTDEKQIEIALRISRARLDHVMSSSPSILYSCKDFQDITISFVSSNILNILGYNPEQFLFDTEFWEKQIHPEDREAAMHIRRQILTSATDLSLEYRVLNSQQEYVWIFDTLTILKDNCDRPLEIIGQWIDITERKQLEVELRLAIEREKELHELKSRFISMTSHEFRTPLSTILSSSELLEYYRHKLTEEKQLGHLQRIQAAVRHMTNLLNDVLLIGKAEAGKLEYNPQLIELVSYCQYIIENILIMIKSTDRILFTHSAASIPAYMDERLLEHILTNLLNNAVKYSPPETKVNFDLAATSTQITFTIQDQGIGIPPSDIPHLFESFHRATNVGNIQGTGLGLAIVKQCVNLHQGEIDVYSELGKGTTFIVKFPHQNP